jgi:hypothetical protein
MLGNQPGKQKGCHGRCGYVDQGISKENGGKELPGPRQGPNDQLGTARSLLSQTASFDPIEGKEGCLCGRETR